MADLALHKDPLKNHEISATDHQAKCGAQNNKRRPKAPSVVIISTQLSLRSHIKPPADHHTLLW